MTIETVRRLVEDAPRWQPRPTDTESVAESAPFRLVNMGELDDADPAQAWHWSGLIPAGHVTLLAGHGGAGKSWLGLQLAACTAMGVECFGRGTERSRVMYYSAEDAAPLVLRRLRLICRRLGFSFAEVREWLQVVDASESEPLYCEIRADGVRHGVATATYAALRDLVQGEPFGLVVVDNASDAFGGDEISRQQVRGFARALAGLVRGHGGAVLLLAHVDKATSRGGKLASGEAYSGSTAWHNSVRSRLFLLETDPGQLELQHLKCNVGPKSAPLRLEWPVDDVIRLRQAGGLVEALEARSGTKVLLGLIHEYGARGEFVAAGTSSPNNAARLLSREAAYPKALKPADTFAALRDAERQGLLTRETYRDAGRKVRERWALTSAGCALIGVAPTAPTAPTTQEGADGAAGAEGAPTAPTSVRGVRGAERAHTDRAKEPK